MAVPRNTETGLTTGFATLLPKEDQNFVQSITNRYVTSPRTVRSNAALI